jgi:hypothetical protein
MRLSTALRTPTPSFVLSAAALLVALGGTGYAVATIDGADVRNGSLTGKDVKNQSLTTKDIANGSIKPKDLRPGVIPVATRWVLVNAAGQIEAQSGGFEVKAAYGAGATGVTVPGGAIANVYIDANEPLDDNSIVSSIALQNVVEQNANGNTNGLAVGPDANPEFSGEIASTRCGITGVVGCAPTGTNDVNHFVVSPRLSDGSPTTAEDRKRFYVIITGDSSDYVAP